MDLAPGFRKIARRVSKFVKDIMGRKLLFIWTKKVIDNANNKKKRNSNNPICGMFGNIYISIV